MSESIRTFSNKTPSSRRRGRFGRRLLGLLVLVVIVAAALFLWLTRDARPLHEFIAADQELYVAVEDFAANRAILAASPLLDFAPDAQDLRASLELAQEQDAPDWVLHNILGSRGILTRTDGAEGEWLFVTRMHRIGAGIAWLHQFSGAVESDPAGGLRLRHMPEQGVYYTVRGRALIASASREALIHSLTLLPEAQLSPESQLLTEGGAEQVRGVWTPAAGSLWAEHVRTATFAMRTNEQTAAVRSRVLLSTAARRQWAPVLEDLRPQSLVAPIDGWAGASFNLDRPLSDVLADLSKAIDRPELQPSATADGGENAEPSLAAEWGRMEGLLRTLGPGFRISWVGADLNAMVPLPEIVAAAEGQRQVVSGMLAQMTAPPEALPWESYPRYEASRRLVRWPMPGGPSLEPSFAAHGEGLMASSSLLRAEELLAQPLPAEPMEEEGNAYLVIRPRPCLEAVAGAGSLLAEQGLLREYDQAAWAEQMKLLRERFERIGSVSLLAGHEDGVFDIRLRIDAAEEDAAP
jgi:hypothetical protein